MSFNPITQSDLDFFRTFLEDSAVISSDELLHLYSHDETEDLSFLPGVVLKPNSPEQISKIVKYANEKSIAVTPQGARTGLSGGALPLYSGVALSMEKFNRIL